MHLIVVVALWVLIQCLMWRDAGTFSHGRSWWTAFALSSNGAVLLAWFSPETIRASNWGFGILCLMLLVVIVSTFQIFMSRPRSPA